METVFGLPALDYYWFMIDGFKLLCFTAVLIPLEMLFPVQNISFKNRLPHIIFILITAPLFMIAMKVACTVVMGMSFHDGRWFDSDQIPVPALDFLPIVNLAPFFAAIPFPGAAFALLTIFISDGVLYWWHRTMHTIPVLWPLHKLHHVDEHLNVFTTNIAHPLHNIPWTFFMTLLGAYFVRCSGGHITPDNAVDSMMATFIFWKITGWFIHSNVKVSFGPLTWLYVSPQLHRIHHSKEERHMNSNFVDFFPIWDILFGTYYRPKKDEWPESGVNGETLQTSQWALAAQPFRDWLSYFRAKRASQ
ncbi:MAG: sterol desaturase family protein [Bdellovibrionia bacterium]